MFAGSRKLCGSILSSPAFATWPVGTSKLLVETLPVLASFALEGQHDDVAAESAIADSLVGLQIILWALKSMSVSSTALALSFPTWLLLLPPFCAVASPLAKSVAASSLVNFLAFLFRYFFLLFRSTLVSGRPIGLKGSVHIGVRDKLPAAVSSDGAME